MFEIALTDRLITTYDEYRKEISNTLKAAAEDFVYAGYLLRQAKEKPEVLADTSYEDYKDFAAAEFGLEASQVSRFISINEKYGDGPRLLPQYQGYGQSKLSEMLSLPSAVAEELPQSITRAEIRDIKNEIKEEMKTTDIEVAIERAQCPVENIWSAFFKSWIKDNPQKFVELDSRSLYEDLFAGCSLVARVPGEGKLLMTEKDDTVTITNMRSGEKVRMPGEQIEGLLVEMAQGDEHLPFPFTKEQWERITGETFPEEEKKADRQQDNSHLSTAPETEEKPEPIEEHTDAQEEEPEEEEEAPEEDEAADQSGDIPEDDIEEAVAEEVAEEVEAVVEDIPEELEAVGDIKQCISQLEDMLKLAEARREDTWIVRQRIWIDIQTISTSIKEIAKREETACGKEGA